MFLYGHLKKPWFWLVFAFSRIFFFSRYFGDFFICYKTWLWHFSSTAFQAHHLQCSIRKTQRKTEKCLFLNKNQIKKWEYKPLGKNELLGRWWQNFWVLNNLPTFLVKKPSFKNSHMDAQKKRLGEANSVLRMTNLLKISTVPKFFIKISQKSQIKNFRLIEWQKLNLEVISHN